MGWETLYLGAGFIRDLCQLVHVGVVAEQQLTRVDLHAREVHLEGEAVERGHVEGQLDVAQVLSDHLLGEALASDEEAGHGRRAGGNRRKIGLPGKLILRDYFSITFFLYFPKTFSLTENQFCGKIYFYTIGPCSRGSRA